MDCGVRPDCRQTNHGARRMRDSVGVGATESGGSRGGIFAVICRAALTAQVLSSAFSGILLIMDAWILRAVLLESTSADLAP